MKGIAWIKKSLTHPVLGLVLRVYVGGVFIYASMYKISYPGEFAEAIASYQIIPAWGVNLAAVVMPWTELLCGLLLVLGLRIKAAAAVIGSLLVVFSLAIAFALIRGLPIGCGCFTSVEDPIGWGTLARDLVWLAMTLQIFLCPSALRLEDRLLASLKEVAG